MKKILQCFIFVLCCFLTTLLPSYATGGVLCNSEGTVCTVGYYTLRGLNLSVKNGVMCNSSGTLCTNGYSVYRGSGANRNTETTRSQEKKTENIIAPNNSTEILKLLSELYNEGLIVQSEFNSKKANINTVNIDKLVELKKMGNLYKNNMITQCDYNRIKNQLLR